MQIRHPQWSDDDVRAYLESSGMPVERCRVNDGLYGVVTEDGRELAIMDDDDARCARVIKFLKKIGAANFSTF